MRREQLNVGQLFLQGDIDKNGVYVSIRDVKQLDLAVKCFGAGAPTNSKAGYAIGAEYTNITTGAKYVNTGTGASSTWTAAGTIIGLTALAAELNMMVDTPATVTMATTPATGSCAVQLTFKNTAGAAISHVFSGMAYSSAVDGLSVVAVTSFATLTNGAVDPIITTKNFHFITSAAGLLGITLTASPGTYYLTFQLPNGALLTTGAIVVN
jgi:hypothetical protein